MSTQRYTPEFKEEAVGRVVERACPFPEVAARLEYRPIAARYFAKEPE